MLSARRLADLETLQKRLGYRFEKIELLNKALSHKSFVNENPKAIKNNERFEFLGDAVLDLIVSDYMLLTFEDYPEGTLSKIRAAIVNEACLANLARKIDLGRFMLLGRGEDMSGGREKASLLANTYEAVVGALYRDGGLARAEETFIPVLKPEIEKFRKSCEFRDYKSELQEYTQNEKSCIPQYRVIAESGPDHNKEFLVEVLIRNRARGQGQGRSKKEAEQNAARVALVRAQKPGHE